MFVGAKQAGLSISETVDLAIHVLLKLLII